MRNSSKIDTGERRSTLVRLPVALHRALKAKADSEHRSVNAEITVAIERWLTEETDA